MPEPDRYPQTPQPGTQSRPDAIGAGAPRPGRRHMGTATSNPNYLPQTAYQRQRDQDPHARATPIRDAAAPRRSGTVDSGRYLQTPKRGRAIFTSPYTRQHRRMKRVLAALVSLAILLAIVWFAFLR